MAIPISVALVLVLFLASALRPGLMAAPLRPVTVPTPPIEQNITRRDSELDVYLYAARISDSNQQAVRDTMTIRPDEWIQIRVGNAHLLYPKPERPSSWTFHPFSLSPSNPTVLANDHSTFLIATVHCSSIQVRDELFGSLLNYHTVTTKLGLIHKLKVPVLFEIGNPATPVDYSLGGLAIMDQIKYFLQMYGKGVTFEEHLDAQHHPALMSYMTARVNWVQYEKWPRTSEWRGWDTAELRRSEDALRQAQAWDVPAEVVEGLPRAAKPPEGYYELKKHKHK
ncbi:hypothetical protein F5878DRAFT_661877 [Lentinula raphanica]|uniref:Uncharacterized protein n=1 Tax=Lentinula raphanica TaxID=153919 RepID=A0AA38P7Q5_9AGAR|nr:hypothetical protein F5878DRAFT_661877 [Lentinula raphanica]